MSKLLKNTPVDRFKVFIFELSKIMVMYTNMYTKNFVSDTRIEMVLLV